jgi:hypothetical protein
MSPAAPFVWLGSAVGVAAAALVLAFASAPFLSLVLAIVGLPLSAYSAVAVPSRAAVGLALAALAVSLLVLGYWAYALLDALQGIR